MTPAPHRKKMAKMIVLVGCLLLLAVIVAALVNPLIVKVPLKILMGEGGLMRHMATVHATLDGTDIEYDVYGGKTTHAAGWSGTELVLISKSPQTVTNAHGLFPELLVRKDDILFPNGLEFLKLPFGFFPMTCLGGIKATSGKAGVFYRTMHEISMKCVYRPAEILSTSGGKVLSHTPDFPLSPSPAPLLQFAPSARHSAAHPPPGNHPLT